jgi:thermostable 8-oxoguanine DNA glycosylase
MKIQPGDKVKVIGVVTKVDDRGCSIRIKTASVGMTDPYVYVLLSEVETHEENNRLWIDPENVTNFNRDLEELEAFWIFAICVAGKNSQTTAKQVNRLLTSLLDSYNRTPFSNILQCIEEGSLEKFLSDAHIGQYTRITQALRESTEKLESLPTVSLDTLESIYGVGPKTARFFLVHSRPGVQLAVLDVHILRWLRRQGYDVPSVTPSGKKYLEIEKLFLAECVKRNKTPAELDLEIWREK